MCSTNVITRIPNVLIMERREFLKSTTLASSLFFVPSFVHAFENIAQSQLGHKKLVIVQLSGGNDGLNSIIPYTNDIYYNARPKLAIPKKEAIFISDDVGLHNSLLPLKKLYDKGYVSIINNVGYPNPNRSHFRSTDIWHTACNSDEYLHSGWIGRYLDLYAQHSYQAIETDEALSLALKGSKITGIATKDPRLFYRATQQPYLKQVLIHYEDTHLSEHNLGYLYKTMISAESSASYLFEKSKIYTSKETYPKTPFGKQLKTVAELINSNVATSVFYTSLDGFDTHANQANIQKRLLENYAKGMEVFVRDLKNNNSFKDTLILTFSEFGRRVKQNAANGTDHGAANTVFLIGENLKTKGFYNNLATLGDLDDNGDIKYEIDFRSIYATILYKWLKANDEIILKQSFEQLDVI